MKEFMMTNKKTQYKQQIHNSLKAVIMFLSFMLIFTHIWLIQTLAQWYYLQGLFSTTIIFILDRTDRKKTEQHS